jgi:hypothetical protein
MAGGNVAALQAAIEKLRARTILEQQEALEILQIYINNLREHPTEKKYHRINAVNVHFQERIGRLACCEECMAAIGYKKARAGPRACVFAQRRADSRARRFRPNGLSTMRRRATRRGPRSQRSWRTWTASSASSSRA